MNKFKKHYIKRGGILYRELSVLNHDKRKLYLLDLIDRLKFDYESNKYVIRFYRRLMNYSYRVSWGEFNDMLSTAIKL